MDGRMVAVTTKRLGGGEPMEEIWAAAIDDDTGAERAAREVAQCTADQVTAVRGKISQTNLDALGLKPGNCKAWLGG